MCGICFVAVMRKKASYKSKLAYILQQVVPDAPSLHCFLCVFVLLRLVNTQHMC